MIAAHSNVPTPISVANGAGAGGKETTEDVMSVSNAVIKDEMNHKTDRNADTVSGPSFTLERCARPAARYTAAFDAGIKQAVPARPDRFPFQISLDHRETSFFKKVRISTRGQPQRRRSRSWRVRQWQEKGKKAAEP